MKMRRLNRVVVGPKQKILMPVKTNRYRWRRASTQPIPLQHLPARRPGLLSLFTLSLSLLMVLTVLILATLNGVIFILRSRSVPTQNYSVIINRLPTLTPTTNAASIAMGGQVVAATTTTIIQTPIPTINPASATPVQVQAAVVSPAAQSVAQVPPTLTPWPTPTAVPTNAPQVEPLPTIVIPAPASVDISGQWSFAATRVDPVPARNMLMLYGEMINDTGTTQQVSSVAGTFYDSQGQVITADKDTDGVWPTDVIPPGGHVPFLLTVKNIRNASNFDLSVQSEPVETIPRQDFEFIGVNEQVSGARRCLSGALKNPGGQLADYLVIAGIFYDDQGNILRFADDNKSTFSQVTGDEALNFKICIKSPPNSNVTSHQLLAWGS